MPGIVIGRDLWCAKTQKSTATPGEKKVWKCFRPYG